MAEETTIKQYNQYIYRDGKWLLVGYGQPIEDITYSLSQSGNSITLNGSDGSTSTVTIDGISQEDKAKLDGIEDSAQINKIESIKVNGTVITIASGKIVDITVPTKTSDLTNDSNFVSDSSYIHTDNNFTTTLKNKLDGISTGAEVNKINSIKVNGTAQTISNKTIDITVPTKTSDLTNDSNFVSDANYVHTDNNYTTNEKTKLAGIAENANNYVLPTASTTLGGVRTTSNVTDLTDYEASPIVNGVVYSKNDPGTKVIVSKTQPSSSDLSHEGDIWVVLE